MSKLISNDIKETLLKQMAKHILKTGCKFDLTLQAKT